MSRALFFTEGWGVGGIESFLMGLLRSDAFQESGMQFDIFSVCDWDSSFDDEVRSLGGSRCVAIPGKRAGLREKYSKGPSAFRRLLRQSAYDVAYINITNGAALLYASIAKNEGVKRVIVHSHSAGFSREDGHDSVKKALHSFGRALWLKSADVRLACSEAAGRWLYGPDSFSVVYNGINVDRFSFKEDERVKVRQVLQIPADSCVIGSIGRVDATKNPFYQIDVFQSFLELRPEAYYLMVGSGPLVGQVKSYVSGLGLAGRVQFISWTDSPSSYYSALDVLLMPSRVEGFPFVAIEAQCTGLPVLVSDAVTREIGITPLVEYESLGEGSVRWAETVDSLVPESNDGRHEAWLAVKGTPCDVEMMARRVVAVMQEKI